MVALHRTTRSLQCWLRPQEWDLLRKQCSMVGTALTRKMIGPPPLYRAGPGSRSMVTPNSCCRATPLDTQRASPIKHPFMPCMQKGWATSKGSSSPAVCVIPLPHELQKLHFVHEGCQWQGPVQEEHSQREGRQCLDLSKQPHEDRENCSL